MRMLAVGLLKLKFSNECCKQNLLWMSCSAQYDIWNMEVCEYEYGTRLVRLVIYGWQKSEISCVPICNISALTRRRVTYILRAWTDRSTRIYVNRLPNLDVRIGALLSSWEHKTCRFLRARSQVSCTGHPG